MVIPPFVRKSFIVNVSSRSRTVLTYSTMLVQSSNEVVPLVQFYGIAAFASARPQ